MSRRLLEEHDVRAEWRIDVDDTERLCSFDVALDALTACPPRPPERCGTP